MSLKGGAQFFPHPLVFYEEGNTAAELLTFFISFALFVVTMTVFGRIYSVTNQQPRHRKVYTQLFACAYTFAA